MLLRQHPCAYTGASCPSLDPAQEVLEQQRPLHHFVLLSRVCLLGLCCLAGPCQLAGAHLLQLLAAPPQQPVLACRQHPPRAGPLVH